VYLQNNKDFEKTLNQFLTGDLPKTEIKVTIVETQDEVKKKDDAKMIDTGAGLESKSAFRDSPHDIKSYVLDEFKDILFPK
jgi:hypothetical protein